MSPSAVAASDAVDIATSLAPNGFDHGGAVNGNGVSNGVTNGVSNGNGAHSDAQVEGKPKNWIPIAEHVLHAPVRKVKMISIGCGFSGMFERASKILIQY
jgi:hypothetical protein